jgi:hypothetical protein
MEYDRKINSMKDMTPRQIMDAIHEGMLEVSQKFSAKNNRASKQSTPKSMPDKLPTGNIKHRSHKAGRSSSLLNNEVSPKQK